MVYIIIENLNWFRKKYVRYEIILNKGYNVIALHEIRIERINFAQSRSKTGKSIQTGEYVILKINETLAFVKSLLRKL